VLENADGLDCRERAEEQQGTLKMNMTSSLRRTARWTKTVMANPPPSVAGFGSSATGSGKQPHYEPPPSIGRQKMLIRRHVRNVLQEISPESLATQGEEVLKHLKAFTHYVESSRVSCYKSMRSAELPTDSIIKNLLDNRKKVFLPFVHEQNKKHTHRMDMLELESWEEFNEGLVPVSFSSSPSSPQVFQFDPTKISTRENARTEGLDLVLLPGLAFDRYGNRLGHGKGFYDEYLNEYNSTTERNHKQQESVDEKKKKRQPILVGICLREQVLSEEDYIPTLAHDRRLDYVVSPDGVLPRIK